MLVKVKPNHSGGVLASSGNYGFKP